MRTEIDVRLSKIDDERLRADLRGRTTRLEAKRTLAWCSSRITQNGFICPRIRFDPACLQPSGAIQAVLVSRYSASTEGTRVPEGVHPDALHTNSLGPGGTDERAM